MNKRIHRCGNGFTGQVIRAKGIKFCGFCGKELGTTRKTRHKL